MYIVAIGWMFVVACMAAVESMSSIGGAIATFLFYGLLPLALVLWLIGTPQRRRNRAGPRKRIAGASFTPARRDDETD